jgi:hypothetical protein
MKSETCPRGGEQYEEYYSEIVKASRIQYDYRDHNGKLFSCIAKTLEEARERRDKWLAARRARSSYKQRTGREECGQFVWCSVGCSAPPIIHHGGRNGY